MPDLAISIRLSSLPLRSGESGLPSAPVAAMPATNGDHSSDRMTLREIEIAIRSAMPLPVQSVVFIDEGGRLGVARNLDTRSVSGAKAQPC